MLPSVNDQKPVVTDASVVSADETLRAISLENALSVDLIRLGYQCFCRPCQPIDIAITGPPGGRRFYHTW
jgi:hypothetical protein